ncbi:Serine/threonine-protein phosphatase 2A activator [Schizosaccharomyces pombe]
MQVVDEKTILELENERFDESSQFKTPEKLIVEASDMTAFRQSKAYYRIFDFLQRLNIASVGVNDYHVEYSTRVEKLVRILCRVKEITKTVPPASGRHRFGNPAFRIWHEKLRDSASQIMDIIIPDSLSKAKVELLDYFLGSFGNSQRIDFGTGHELNFLGFIKGLDLLGLLDAADYKAIALYITHVYLEVCRELVQTYRLEPAGSHGVWGLDDHFFIPYIFGSAQLADKASSSIIKPDAILNKKIVDEKANSNLYFSAIKFINVMKKGPFYEHSPILYDITAVPMWSKVNQGLIKMYDVEVLSKYPVVQHFHFGNLFPFNPLVAK